MWTLTFTILDGKTKSGSFSLNFDATKTIAQIEAWIGAVILPINAIIKGAITAISLSRAVSINPLFQQIPLDSADVEEKMKTVARTATGFYSSFAIPTLDETLVNAGSSTINQADPAIVLFNTAIEVGVDVAGVMVGPTDNRGARLALITSQNEVFES